LAYDALGTPRPNYYYPDNQMQLPIVTDRFEAKQQIDMFSAQ
jgi:photosystem II cytochrome b559 subunit alpha